MGWMNDNVNGSGFDSPIKGRSSLLPNAQLEITKVGSNSTRKGKNSGDKGGNNFFKNYQLNGGSKGGQAVDRNTGVEKGRPHNLDITILHSGGGAHNQTHLSNKPAYQKAVARHLCQKFNQNEISNDIFEVF